MKTRLVLPVVAALAVVLLIGTFATGYAVGWYDCMEECRVRSGEIKVGHPLIPDLLP